MARVTPALDRLTEMARAEFLRNLSRPDAPGPGVPQGMTMGGMLASKAAASGGASSYLQLGSLVRIAVPRLYNLDRELFPRAASGEEIVARAVRDPALDGVGEEITANVRAVVRDVDDYLIGLLSEMLRGYSDADVGALLLELWHIHDEEFDPDAPGNDVDFNADDAMPANSDTPHSYLLDLIVDTVIARLMKRHGPELLLAWTDAVGNASRQM